MSDRDIEERINILKTDLLVIKDNIIRAEDLSYYVKDDLKHLDNEELQLNIKNNLSNIINYLDICNTLLFNCNRLLK